MDSDRVLIAALLLIGIIVFSNLVMYAIARGAKHDSNRANWMKAMQDSIRQPFKKEDDSLSELRKRVEELKKR